jgi:cell division protein FtsX
MALVVRPSGRGSIWTDTLRALGMTLGRAAQLVAEDVRPVTRPLIAAVGPSLAPVGADLQAAWERIQTWEWVLRYFRNLADYSWRWQRRRVASWFLTVAVIGAVLAVAGAVQLVVALGQRSLASQMQSASEMQVFLQDAASQAQDSALQAKLARVPGVHAVALRTKADAQARAAHDPQLATLANASQGNPFPASLVVTMSDPNVAKRVISAAAGDPALDPKIPSSYTAAQAQSLGRAISAIQVAAGLVDTIALGLGALVATALLRGEVRARREELRILALVGVPRMVTRLPLLFQALSVAIVSSTLAVVAITWFGHNAVPGLDQSLPFLHLGDPAIAIRGLSAGTVGASLLTLIPCALLVRLPR